MAQAPHGPKGLFCPLWQKSMDKVCHTCPLWTQLRGKNPQSEQEIDEWGCALQWLPMLLIENAQQARQAGASTDKVATEVHRLHLSVKDAQTMSAAILINSHGLHKIENGETKLIEAEDE